MVATYLDHNASTSFPEELWTEVQTLLAKSLASPSSLHRAGRISRRVINEATESVARFLHCDGEFIYWTSGATEANTWALTSAFEAALLKGRKPRFLLSPIEHESVLLTAAWLQKKGLDLQFLEVQKNGLVDLEDFKSRLQEASSRPWDLVSVMLANNETGVIQPLHEILSLCRDHSIPSHMDCAQALGKIPLSIKDLQATYSTFSGHKIGAPKGVGFLVVQGEGRILFPLIHGKQQKGLRGGTENALSCGLVGTILNAAPKQEGLNPLAAMRSDFESELQRLISGTVIYGSDVPRLPNTTYVGFEGVDGDGILLNLDLEAICASSGAACSSGSLDPSHVLLAMGYDKKLARSSVRFSSGRGTQWADYERVLSVLPEIVERVRKANL